MDSILELLKSIPIVGWVIGGVVVLIGVNFVNKKGSGGNSSGISLDGILGNLRNNRGRTERAVSNNRETRESVDSAGDRIEESQRIIGDAEESIDSARNGLNESQRINESAQATVDSLSDGVGDGKEQLSRARSIIDRVRSRNSAN